jgi:hypothetical protein
MILWRTDSLLGKHLETNNETTAVAMQQRDKHASATIELLLETVLGNPLLGTCNGWTATMETEEFSMWSVPKSSLEDNLGHSFENKPVNRRLGFWCEMASSLEISCQLSVES